MVNMIQSYFLVNEDKKEYITPFCLGYGHHKNLKEGLYVTAREWCEGRIGGLVYYLTLDYTYINSINSGILKDRLYFGRWKNNRIGLFGNFVSGLNQMLTLRNGYRDITRVVAREIKGLTGKLFIKQRNRGYCECITNPRLSEDELAKLKPYLRSVLNKRGLFVNEDRQEYICGACMNVLTTSEFLNLVNKNGIAGWANAGLYLLLVTDRSGQNLLSSGEPNWKYAKYAGLWGRNNVRYIVEDNNDYAFVVRDYKNITKNLLQEYFKFIGIECEINYCSMCWADNTRWSDIIVDVLNSAG